MKRKIQILAIILLAVLLLFSCSPGIDKGNDDDASDPTPPEPVTLPDIPEGVPEENPDLFLPEWLAGTWRFESESSSAWQSLTAENGDITISASHDNRNLGSIRAAIEERGRLDDTSSDGNVYTIKYTLYERTEDSYSEKEITISLEYKSDNSIMLSYSDSTIKYQPEYTYTTSKYSQRLEG